MPNLVYMTKKDNGRIVASQWEIAEVPEGTRLFDIMTPEIAALEEIGYRRNGGLWYDSEFDALMALEDLINEES